MRLFAIGDIQGCAAAFDLLLRKIAFRPARDKLWLVGDLVNRGPDSLGVVRRVMSLGRSVTCVLGNHDLHLLATVAGRRELSPADTFHDVLEAPDLDSIVDWLRRRPLLHYDSHAKRVLVHAGIPPPWTVAEARAEARDVEEQLRGRQWRHALKEMYGGEPSVWSRKLRGADRRRYTINALTRMRYCDRRGRIDLSYSGAPGTQPKGLIPWFDVPERRAARAHIVF
ncbi:MAG TPA: symmetrical bis(5'-nucleosyl)-tetraphosphatase, partial [Gammaproteobacteria bacterium]